MTQISVPDDTRVVIIRFSSLGDCILLLPLAAHLKACGVSEVTVVTKRRYVPVFAGGRGVDRVIALAGGIRALLDIAAELRGRGYVVLDAHNNWRSRLLSWRLGGAAARFDKHYRERLGLIVFKRQTPLPTVMEQYGRLALPVTGSAAPLAPGAFAIPPSARARAASDMEGWSDAVAIAPGARWPSKRWGLDRYLALARHLVDEKGLRVVLVGDHADRETCAPIATALGEQCLDISGGTGIAEAAAYIARCRALVGNDSGLMHLAEAVGVPVVALFGPTVDAFGYYPRLPNSRTVERSLACRPCSRNGAIPCPRGTNECLRGIAMESVASALAGALAGEGPRRITLDRGKT